MDGVPANRVKDKMTDLEQRKAELGSQLTETAYKGVLLHPRMAGHCREEIARLRELLASGGGSDALALMRQLIDHIVLTPVEDARGRESLSVDLHGQLAGILSLANKLRKPMDLSGPAIKSMKLVAGVGFEPTTFGL